MNVPIPLSLVSQTIRVLNKHVGEPHIVEIQKGLYQLGPVSVMRDDETGWYIRLPSRRFTTFTEYTALSIAIGRALALCDLLNGVDDDDTAP